MTVRDRARTVVQAMESPRRTRANGNDRWMEGSEVVGRVVARTLSGHDAEDACQQAIVEAMEYGGPGRRIQSWRGLCGTIARRVCARTGRPAAFEPFGDFEPRADDAPPEAPVTWWFRAVFVPALEPSLTARQRAVLGGFLRGSPVKRIAAELRTTPKSVRDSIKEIVKKARAMATICPPRSTLSLQARESLRHAKTFDAREPLRRTVGSVLEAPGKHGSARAERLGSSFAKRTAATRLRAAEPAMREAELTVVDPAFSWSAG